MKWDCDAWWQKREKWHRYFAWYPIKVALNDCRWLEYVERKGLWIKHSDEWFYEYRAPK